MTRKLALSDRDKLATRVVKRVRGIALKLRELEDDLRRLWKEFDKLEEGETISAVQPARSFAPFICTGHREQFNTCSTVETDESTSTKPCELFASNDIPLSALQSSR